MLSHLSQCFLMTQLLSLCSTAWSYLPHILSVFFSSYSWWIFISFTEGREQANSHLLASFPLCFFMTWPFIHSLYLSHFLQLSLQARSHWDQRKEEMERGKPKPPRTRLSHAFFSFLLNLSQSSSKYLFNISHLSASLRLFLTSHLLALSFTQTISLSAPFLLLVFSNQNICHYRWH